METSRTTAQYDRNDRYNLLYEIEWILSPATDTTRSGRDTTAFCNGTIACNSYDKCNKNVSQNTPLLFSKWRRRSNVTLNARSPLSWRNFCAMNHFTTNSQTITRTNKLEIPGRNFCLSSCFNSCTRVLYSPSCSLARTQNLCFLRFGLSLRLRRTALRRN